MKNLLIATVGRASLVDAGKCFTLLLATCLFASMGSRSVAQETAVADKETESEAHETAEDAEPNAAASSDASKTSKPAARASQSKTRQRRSKKAKARYAHIVLSSSLPESAGQTSPFGDLGTDLRQTVARFTRAAKDDSIRGIVLDLSTTGLGNGKVNELRAAIRDFRKSDKKVYAQLESATAENYLIATACDEIVMPEAGFLLLPGIRMEPIFYKGLLAKIGVKADFLHMGEAKGYGETFTRKKYSKAVRQNLDAMAGDMFEQMVKTIAFDRPVTEAKAREMIDLALITATQAKQAGLIDRVAYPDELREMLAEQHKGKQLVYVENYGRKKVDTDFSGPTGFFKLMQAIAGNKPTKGRRAGKKIAIVYAVGAITPGKSQNGLFGEVTMGSDTIVKALKKAAQDEQVAAIVLRVDSPGGSALASDLIWRQIEKIEQPVIASMGNVAASGGYYISMGADKIFAEPGTVTGSIGVVSGKFAFAEMYDKLGLTTDTITRGQNSGIFSGMRKWTNTERAAMMRLMEEGYETFTSKAAAGRSMPVEQLKKLAGGRVYTGQQAKANGLVDELGTLADAVAAAKKLARLSDEEKVRIEALPEPPDFFESLFGQVGNEREVRISLDGLVLPAKLKRSVARLMIWSQLLEREPIGMFVPFDLSIE